ncbi:Tll0287-like domain-containing protein [Alkalimarinus coralli]|uniref:Tll0287-like domain-containing protein n=1 Tax=Alkalimarinus coralli TaxID=2935863 RepID=UPI00202B3666|nr:DUF3365 domain-containing protein [Alkalimarinus coralli]
MFTKMRKTKSSTLLLVALLTTQANASERIASLENQSRDAIKSLATELKSELVAKMKEGGPIAALKVCNVKAPVITSSVSLSKNLEVKRTSLKTRNQSNTPDKWEREILVSFEKQKLAGANVSELDQSSIMNINGQKYFRYMKAIPTQKPCLACHGKNIDKALRESIAELYPNDQATGFDHGDIRGAFTVKIPL